MTVAVLTAGSAGGRAALGISPGTGAVANTPLVEFNRARDWSSAMIRRMEASISSMLGSAALCAGAVIDALSRSVGIEWLAASGKPAPSPCPKIESPDALHDSRAFPDPMSSEQGPHYFGRAPPMHELSPKKAAFQPRAESSARSASGFPTIDRAPAGNGRSDYISRSAARHIRASAAQCLAAADRNSPHDRAVPRRAPRAR
jgi:hypothetical protein